MLKLIQLGLTFTDEKGNLPRVNNELCVWQFNFKCVLWAARSLTQWEMRRGVERGRVDTMFQNARCAKRPLDRA